MKKHLLILIGIIIFISCRDLGKLVDEKKSDSYFITADGQIIYCQDGNWFELGVDSMHADAKSFKVLSAEIGEDKNYVFFRSAQQKNVDRNSFYVENDIPKDRYHAYYIDESLGFNIIKGADAETFEYLKENNWSRDKDHYFYNLNRVNVDRQTFKIINKSFSEDKDSVYMTTDIYIDTTTNEDFKAVLPNIGNPQAINNVYMQNQATVYYISYNPRPKLLSQSFHSIDKIKIISDDIICVNNKTIISYGKKFAYANVDVNTFTLFPAEQLYGEQADFSKDKNNVYFYGEIIPKADPNTFKPLGFFFGKDTEHAYYKTRLLEGVDAESFKETDLSDTGKFEYRDKLGNRFDYMTGNKL